MNHLFRLRNYSALAGCALAFSGVQQTRVSLADQAKDETTVDVRKAIERSFSRVANEIVRQLVRLEDGDGEPDAPLPGNQDSLFLVQNGKCFDKASVETSVVTGELPQVAVDELVRSGYHVGRGDVVPYYAAGITAILHPQNPMVPSVHMNYYFLELTLSDDTTDGEKQLWWFGGGQDLTPAYLVDEDIREYHNKLKDVCDKHDEGYYVKFKKQCDDKFFLPHRQEARGVGGIYFDNLTARPGNADTSTPAKIALLDFVADCADSFLPSYMGIVERRKDESYSQENKNWQLLRRGRYVEANLMYDADNKFGLDELGSNIDNALPIQANWRVAKEPAKGSEEARLLQVLRQPRDWDDESDARSLRNASFSSILAELAQRSKKEKAAKKNGEVS